MKKLLNMLFILSICMIGLTSFASTQMVEQKQNPTITLEQSVEVVKVQSPSFEVAAVDATIFTETNLKSNSFISADDVGYQDKNLELVSKSINNYPAKNSYFNSNWIDINKNSGLKIPISN